MIRLVPERADHSTKKRNKSYTEGMRSHTSETQSLNNHLNLQQSNRPKQAKRRIIEGCFSMGGTEKWECNIDNLEELEVKLKSREKRLPNTRGYFMALYSKHPRKLQRQHLRLLQ